MLTEKKKVPPMLARMKNKKKLKKEDIMKYGTKDEIKLLEDFKEEHGIGGEDDVDDDNMFDIPVGDEEGPEEEISLEDEQESVTSGNITVSEDFLERLYMYLSKTDDDSPEMDDLLDELGRLLGEQAMGENEEELPEGVDEDEIN